MLAEREGSALAGAIAVASDGYLHYYLGGTADEALEDSPMKNLFAAMISLGNDHGVPVNLGGGIRPEDSLDKFKQGFANARAPWYTHEVICDPAAYDGARVADRAAARGILPRLPRLSAPFRTPRPAAWQRAGPHRQSGARSGRQSAIAP